MPQPDFPDIDSIVLAMAVAMDYNTRQSFGEHLISLANDILLVAPDDTAERLNEYQESKQQEGNT